MARLALRALMAAGLVGLGVSIGLAVSVPHPLGPVAAWMWVGGAVLPTYVIGVFAMAMRPDHLAARWLAALGSLLAVQTALNRSLSLLIDLDPIWGLLGGPLGQLVTVGTSAAIGSLLVVFPDHGYRYRYQRRTVWATWVVALTVPVALAASSPRLLFGPFVFPPPEIRSPLFVPALAPLAAVAEAAYQWRAVLWLVGAVAMFVRYRRASADVRARFRWPLSAAAAVIVFVGLFRFLEQVGMMSGSLRQVLLFGGWVPGMALLSASFLVAVLRYRILDIDLWLRRSILFGGASVIVGVVSLALAGLLGLAAGQRVSLGVGVAVALGAVVAFQPLRRGAQGRIRRWVYGTGLEGADLLRHVGATLEDAHDAAQLSSNLAGVIVEGLDLEWVEVSLSAHGRDPAESVARVGIADDDPVNPDVVIPLAYGPETVGSIACGPKRWGELSKEDEEALANVGRQAALAVRNAQLTGELERRLDELRRQSDELAASRTRIIHAQTEERRRTEQNIHDGVQQEVVAAIAKLRLARNQLARDPRLAEHTLAELQEHTRHMLESLRELGRGIHPTVLTDRGLVEALDAQVSRLPLDVQFEPAPQVRRTRYAQDVEAAAYFVVTEGLANVLKHAGTEQATVALESSDESLTVEVSDRGNGYDPDRRNGSGLVSLRDRVESVGGVLEHQSRPGHGASVRAVLPARNAQPASSEEVAGG